ncbi:MAG: nickel/cobalt transporter [Iamia sp.]
MTGILVLGSAPAGAHPLGNFTINTSAALRIRPDEVLVDYVIDLAEIPTLQARPGIDADGDDDLSAAEQQDYAEDSCVAATDGLALSADGDPLTLTSADSDISFPNGQAGLTTTRIECQLRASMPEVDGSTTVGLVDANFADKLGWHEIIAQGDRTTIADTDVEAESTSDRLRTYPSGSSGSPLREERATVRVVPGGPAAPAPDEGGSSGVLPSVDRLTNLVGERQLTIPFALFALVLSFVLGGFHALAPGHGKTVMAAYLVGAEGTRRQALLLGLTVALTHTGGVFALALVVSNSSVAPERLYPILGTFSGLLVAAIGVVLLRRALRFRKIFPTLGPGASTHHHHGIGGHSHTHELGGHSHDHGAGEHSHGDDNDHSHDHEGDPVHQHAPGDDHAHDGHDRSPAPVPHAHGLDADHDHDVVHQHALATDHGHDPAATGDHGQGAVSTGAVRPALAHAEVAPGAGGDALARGVESDDRQAGTDVPATRDDEPDPIDDEAPEMAPRMRLRNMMAMGFAGGLVPSPSALVVLLGSIAIGRAWFGLLLIVAYGAGLAAVLVGAGLVIERLRHRIEPLLARKDRPRWAKVAVNLPVITSVLVMVGGAWLVARALSGA